MQNTYVQTSSKKTSHSNEQVATSKTHQFIMHIAFTAVASTVAAMAAGASAAFNIPVWAMFVGWVAYFTRIESFKVAISNLACVYIGISIGAIAAISLQAINPILGSWSLSIVVFMVGMVVISLRSTPVFNNLLCYFLGLITFFASHLTPSLKHFILLASAVSIGSLAGLVSSRLQKQFL